MDVPALQAGPLVLRPATGNDPRRELRYWSGTVDGEFVGWWSLHTERPARPTGTPVDAEVGYRLARSAWGRGLATAGLRAVVSRGGERDVRERRAVRADRRLPLHRAR